MNCRKLNLVLVILFVIANLNFAQNKFYFSEKSVAGGSGNFLEVKHIKMKGSNFEIGKKLGEIAIKNHKLNIPLAKDKLKSKVQKNYLKKNYPVHFERMKGVSAAFNSNFENDEFDFSQLGYAMQNYGCSAVFYPQNFTENNHGILSRNFEFTTGNIQGLKTKANGNAVMSKPYILEIYPDEGYASISLVSFDLYGAIDGINSEGLTVAILADGETPSQFPVEPTMSGDVGIFELLAMRYLLDNCKNVEEAKEALLELKHFYFLAPLHYVVADKSGKSFIFEFSPTRNQTFIIENENKPQCVTNHLVYKHQNANDFPQGNSFERYKSLFESTSQNKKYSLEEIKNINNKVAADNYDIPNKIYAPQRTIWHELYDVNEKSLQISFYLGDKIDEQGKIKAVRSEYLKFKLDN